MILDFYGRVFIGQICQLPQMPIHTVEGDLMPTRNGRAAHPQDKPFAGNTHLQESKLTAPQQAPLILAAEQSPNNRAHAPADR
jgi:hypothetical protein